MKYGLYSIYDKVACNFGEPFIAINEQVAERRFNFLMTNAPMVSTDCQLFKIGEFDVETGDCFPDKKFVANFNAVGAKEG